MALNAKTKGASGEREFCQYLYDNFKLEIKPERNLTQTRDGGADIICHPFAFEIKRCETLKFYDWWSQVRDAVSNKHGLAFGLIPVVAFRQNKKDWEFLISAQNIGVGFGFVHINSQVVFNEWVKNKIQEFEQSKQELIKDLNIQRRVLGMSAIENKV